MQNKYKLIGECTSGKLIRNFEGIIEINLENIISGSINDSIVNLQRSIFGKIIQYQNFKALNLNIYFNELKQSKTCSLIKTFNYDLDYSGIYKGNCSLNLNELRDKQCTLAHIEIKLTRL